MHVGDPCPFCLRPLILRRGNAPRQGGRAAYAYCPHDEAAWELEADERYAAPLAKPESPPLRNAAASSR